jgi:hypothetical protein
MTLTNKIGFSILFAVVTAFFGSLIGLYHLERIQLIVMAVNLVIAAILISKDTE